MHTFRLLLTSIILFALWTNSLYADCDSAYSKQVARKLIGKNRSPYREMLQILVAARGPSQHSINSAGASFRKLLSKHNKDYDKFGPGLSDDSLGFALNLLNQEEAFCRQIKPLKVRKAASRFFDLLAKQTHKIANKSVADLSNDVSSKLKIIDDVRSTYSQILDSSAITTQLQLLDHANYLPQLDVLRKDADYLRRTLKLLKELNIDHPPTDLLSSLDKYDAVLWIDGNQLLLACLKHIAATNLSTGKDPLIKAQFWFLLEMGNAVNMAMYHAVRAMDPIQVEALQALHAVKLTQPIEYALSIQNKWALKALKFAAKHELIEHHTSHKMRDISKVDSKGKYHKFITEHMSCPSQVMARKRHMHIPDNLIPIYANETELFLNDFIVAYHTIPDTNYQPTLILYIFNAFVAEVLYGITVDMLPRFRKQPFTVWPNVPSLATTYIHDHDSRWRDIGIAASPSLLSETESPPFKDFKIGYINSSAQKPDAAYLIKDILIDLTFPVPDAKYLAEMISDAGETLFKGVGGSILQIALHQDMVADYLFLSEGSHNIKDRGDALATKLLSGHFNINDQVRIITDPRIFLDPDKGRLIHFPYNPAKFDYAKKLFRGFLEEHVRPQLRQRISDSRYRPTMAGNLLVSDFATDDG